LGIDQDRAVSPGGDYRVVAALEPFRDDSALPAIRDMRADELAYVRYRLDVLVARRFLRPFTVVEAEQYREFAARELRLLDALGQDRPLRLCVGARVSASVHRGHMGRTQSPTD
jgi:hypothetical protein